MTKTEAHEFVEALNALCRQHKVELVISEWLTVEVAGKGSLWRPVNPEFEAGFFPTDDGDFITTFAIEEKKVTPDYLAIIKQMEQAYATDPQPHHLFTIARLYDEKGDIDNARVYYLTFVGQPGADLESRQAAVARLTVLGV